MKEQLIHILDQSVCLSRRQMKDYLSGTMEQEEQHAVELHLIACPLCGMAMDGFEKHPSEALSGLNDLNSRFLKAHFDTLVPQIHLNSMAPATAIPSAKPLRQSQGQPIWKHVAIITVLLGAFALIWYYEFGRESSTYVAPTTQVSETVNPVPEPVPVKAEVSAPPAKQKSKAKLHPDDEALIQEAKAMTAVEPVELSDDELTKIFDESTSRIAPAAAETSRKQQAVSGKSEVKQDSPAIKESEAGERSEN